MKKILYIVSTLKHSGPIVVLSNIVKYLDRTKFTPIILTLSPDPKDSMRDYFEKDLTASVHSLGFSRIKGVFFARNAIKKFIKENDIHLIHSHGLRADILVSQLNFPSLSTLHNYPFYDYPMKFGKVKGSLMAYQHLKAIKSAPQRYVACSRTISEEFKKNHLTLHYIQNGVDTKKFYPLEQLEKDQLRDKLNIARDETIYISVGSLIKRKDMATVIRAYLKSDNHNSLLLIAGAGEEFKSLREIANEKVIFLGNIPNVVEYLQISDCFISASLAEGLPNTVLEAMACGLPCILSNIPSHLELYDGVEGVFFNAGDVDQLSFLLKNSTNGFLSNRDISLKQIQEHFDAKVMSKKYQHLYKEKINDTI